MAKDQGPHVVARASLGAGAKREVEARPTCKVDKDELLGLVGRSSTELPRRPKKTDLDLSVEIVTASTDEETVLAKPAMPRSNRVVQTVRRDVSKSPMVPLVPQVAKGSDVAIPMVLTTEPMELEGLDDIDEPFVDVFSQPTRVAPLITSEVPVEPEVLASGSAMVPSMTPTELPPISIRLPSPLVPVRERKRRFAPTLIHQIAIGVVLGCVGLGVYLGIVAT